MTIIDDEFKSNFVKVRTRHCRLISVYMIQVVFASEYATECNVVNARTLLRADLETKVFEIAIQSLTPDAAGTIVQAFIACRLDWCN